ncbi:DUF1631 family protein [Luteimonas kalidii]|uniref:DUF1631 family protein n=1 Tax=Luteimonas kalidii TaxID=3042025 RepID=A0ABT6JRD9_9GAMM|nr:DUF1631 family protein [Luteimonas kalidii]MDH5833159.1 DUF1631 family protein [Luteimonas kalidii]
MNAGQGATGTQSPAEVLGGLRAGVVARVMPWMRDALAAALQDLDARAEANPPSPPLVEDRADVSLLLREVLVYEERWQQQIDILLEGWPRMKAIGGGPLTLMAEDDLRAQLVGAPVIDALEHRFRNIVDLVDRRLYTLAARMGGESHPRNPFAPRAVAETFLRAFTALDSSVRVHALVLRHFAKLASDRLAAVYQWCNGYLADAGCELSSGHEGAFLTGLPPAANARAGPGTPGQAAAAPDRLRSRLAGRRKDPAEGAPRRIRDEEMESLLSLLQSERGAGLDASPDGAQPTSARLRAGLDRIGVGIGIGLGSATRTPWQEASIEVVGRLVDTLVAHAALSEDQVRALRRLALPLLRVALENPGMFDPPRHPVLRVLASIVRLWDGNPGRGQVERALQRIGDEAAAALILDQSASPAKAQALALQIEAEADPHRRRADAVATRLWQSMQGRERLEAARAAADQRLAQVRAVAQLPVTLAEFLSRHWRQWLVQVWLRDGSDSARYRDALALGDALVALDAESDGHAIAGRLLQLEPALRECLAISGLHDDAATLELSRLVAEYADPDAPIGSESPAPLAAAPASHDAHESQASRVGDFAVGDRFARTLDDGASQALTLAWLSPLSGTALLVDAQGARQAVLDAAALGSSVGTGEWRRLVAGDPVDHALTMIAAAVDAGEAGV